MTNKSKQKSASDEELIELCANKATEKLKTKMKSMFDQGLENIRKSYEEEIAAPRAQIVEMKPSQDFVCAQYDDIKNEYESLKKKNHEQSVELKTLKANLADMKEKADEEASKLDGLDQYGRRQNLEFEGVLVTEGKDVVNLVVRIGNLVGAKVKRNDISTAHRLPAKRHSKVNDPPGIIARFISQNVRNEIYSKRAVIKSIDEKDFSLQNMERKKILLTKIWPKPENDFCGWQNKKLKQKIFPIHGPWIMVEYTCEKMAQHLLLLYNLKKICMLCNHEI